MVAAAPPETEDGLRGSGRLFPARLVLALVLGSTVFLNLASLTLHADISHVLRVEHPGADFRDFRAGAAALLTEGSPYSVARYVTPPTAAMLLAPLTKVPFEQARLVMAILVLASFAGVLVAMAKAVALPSPIRRRSVMLALLAAGLSYPFLFLYERGNVDAFVLLFTVLAVLFTGRRPVAAGACLALAVGTKIYPCLLLLPFLLQRRWRLLASFAVTLALLIALAPTAWACYVAGRLTDRASVFKVDENTSLPSTVFYAALAVVKITNADPDPQVIADVSVAIGLCLFVALLGALALADTRKHCRDGSDAVAYLPFMVAVPLLSYHYSLVALLAMVPWLCSQWRPTMARARRRSLILLGIGIAFAQWPGFALSVAFGSLWPQAVNGSALLLVLVAVAVLRWSDAC